MERKSSKEYWWKTKSSSYESCLQRTSSFSLFSSQRTACPVLKHSRVSEVFKEFKVHVFECYGQRNYVLKWKFNLCIRNVSFTFYFKKLLENALRFVTDEYLNILPCSADFTRVDGPAVREV